MAKIPDVVRFQALSNKDRILLTYDDHSRYLVGSIEAMELIDEIQKLQFAFCKLDNPHTTQIEEKERSTTLLSCLREIRNQVENDLESLLLLKGEL